jgi:hypothetical protein
MTTYRVTFAANNTFFSTAIAAETGPEFIEIDDAGHEVIDIQTEMPPALEADLNACEDVVSYEVL